MMKARILSLFLALTLLTGSASPALAAGGYSDVPRDHWAAQSVRRAGELGLFQGVGGGRFGLGEPITRAAFVTALVRLFGWEAERPQSPAFSDVPAGAWYFSAVETAFAHDAFRLQQGRFRPEEPITREEMAVMLVRSLGYTSLAVTLGAEECPFTDVSVSPGYITLAYDLGIVGGTGNGRFDPGSSAAREQAAAVLVRVYDKLHAASRQVQSAGNSRVVSVSTPMSDLDAAAPATPLEPIAELYRALRNAKNSGADPEKTVLQLTAGGVRTLVAGGRVVSTAAVSAGEVRRILTSEDVSTYYDSRYESAYCIYRPNDAQTATLWYQSGESQAAKLRLARLFGVTRYVLA
ncbi:MAG: S-layer homology domain-containing protein [Oscillospiraceae bacterium]|jgi:hypothetical protein|nr:S-layer homology domain-containing protein [Oscillospiraceae bacterium]